ncbi:MAG: DUF4416 family protein [Desulfobacterales bacterium]|jgi:hypothetical protein
MSLPQPPPPAKLVVSLIMKERGLLSELAAELEAVFGPLEMVSRWLAFDFTPYYEAEMGRPLVRRMLAFKTLVAQDRLADIKLATNAIEARHAADGRRRVNIDPGILLLARFVLATGKNFAHRIYLAKGIYADLTLVYARGAFQRLPWTYPDYAGGALLGFLQQARRRYQLEIDHD